MSALVDYLKNLNNSDPQAGIWVNPTNYEEEYRVGQYLFENGGILDDWVCIGDLPNLSFGYQSTSDAIKQFLLGYEIKGGKAKIDYKGKDIIVNIEGIMGAWEENQLAEEFNKFLEAKAEDIEKIWAENEAELFVENDLPLILEAAIEAIKE